MSGIYFSSTKDFKNTEALLKKVLSGNLYKRLDRYGKLGVDALEQATPVDTSRTAGSWSYEVVKSKTNPGIKWYNSNDNDGVSIAVLIQYGHGTGTGGYVQGIDYINPAMRPVFDQILEEVLKEVRS
jgi:hypothetical protein